MWGYTDMSRKDSNQHVSTTYSPLTGKFYKDNLAEANFKHDPAPGIMSLKGKADGTNELISNSNEMALVANAIRNGTILKGAADPTILSHLQQIHLIRTMVGTPVEYFALENAFTTINVDMLQAREPIQGTFGVGNYLKPLEEAEANEAKFDEISYDLLKIPAKVYTPIEDIMRTVINPQTINLATTAWALKKKRNSYALAALGVITDNTNVGVIDTLAAGDFHSTTHTALNIQTVINTHLKNFDTLLTHIVMSTGDFAKYTENTWTNAGPTNMQFNRVIGAGTAPFPGVSGLTAVIDPTVADGAAYLIDKMNGARLAEGPKITRRYYDEERDAEVVKYLDFNQFKIIQPDQNVVKRKFSWKVTFS